jgi:hypothetical protein
MVEDRGSKPTPSAPDPDFRQIFRFRGAMGIIRTPDRWPKGFRLTLKRLGGTLTL